MDKQKIYKSKLYVFFKRRTQRKSESIESKVLSNPAGQANTSRNNLRCCWCTKKLLETIQENPVRKLLSMWLAIWFSKTH